MLQQDAVPSAVMTAASAGDCQGVFVYTVAPVQHIVYHQAALQEMQHLLSHKPLESVQSTPAVWP